MKIDAHHHLWDLDAVSYPWIMDPEPRFFGDHAPIRRNYLLDEFRADAVNHGFEGSVHIQVGAADPMAEARWVHSVIVANADWPMKQVVFCDLIAGDVADTLAQYKGMSSVSGVRQIVGRSPIEDAKTGTNDLLDNPAFVDGLRRAADAGFSFDLQLIPELMPKMADVLAKVPELPVALCHAGSPYDRTDAGLSAWAASLRHLSDLPNVTCKLSGLGMFDHSWTAQSIKPIFDTCKDQFGGDRIMFGSNFPVDSLPCDYHTLVTAYDELAGDDVDFFGGVAAAFYGFDAGINV